jgi:hypothetical protein
MNKFIKTALFSCLICAPLWALDGQEAYDSHFTNCCMRLDYFHTGTSTEEFYSFDEVWKESLWPGSRTRLIDSLDMGESRFRVLDDSTGELLYSRGFCTVFGEWKTTVEAIKGLRRSFSESVRFPWPKKPVRVFLDGRDRATGAWVEKWSVTLDPAFVNWRREKAFSNVPVTALMDNGDPSVKVDLVILPDGYRQGEMSKFRKDSERLLKVLFSTEPYRSRAKDFNVRLVEFASNESGIDDPNSGKVRDNAFSTTFNTFETDRYALSFDNKTIRKAAALAPYDLTLVLMNDPKYGGGGIYNLYSICSADNPWSEYVFTHELGHAFAGLGDEYYTSDVAYSEFYVPGVEPWDPNVTQCTDRTGLKWRDLVADGVPVPTPWDKDAYDAHQADYNRKRSQLKSQGAAKAAVDSMAKANDRWTLDFLKTRTYSTSVGAFEGAGYSSKGLYRPAIDCRMFSKTMAPFCPVCDRAIRRAIESLTR